MLFPQNTTVVAALKPDYMGFIFYPKSPRYAGALDPATLPDQVRRVGIFVNASLSEIERTAERYGLQTVQLHGSESPETCQALREKGYEIIKAFGIATADDLLQTTPYESFCNFFLFDTRTASHGGSGQRFDWRVLDLYNGKTPFLLSGGITPDDTEEILNISHPQFYGIDLNSRFEIEAGLKNTELLERFIKTIRS